MLAVPAKKSKPADWSRAISLKLGEHQSEAYASSIQKLNSTRSRAITVQTADESSLALLSDYLRMLNAVESLFGTDELDDLKFTWYDCFKPKKSFNNHSIRFERMGALFNLAALHSNAGMRADRSTPTGLKSALSHFQAAAGIFAFLREGVAKPVGALTVDLSTEGLQMLHFLMMAQAQACFYEKAVKDKHKPSVLSKLAAQASIFYKRAAEFIALPTLDAILDKNWAGHCSFQGLAYEASAELQLAKAVHAKAQETGSGYGEHIARLGKARETVEKSVARANASKLPATMLDSIRNQLVVIDKLRSKAIADNDKIYMDSIPAAGTLAKPTPYALAKPTVPDDDLVRPSSPDSLKRTGSSQLFAGLVPPDMQAAEAIYQSRISATLAQQAAKVQSSAEQVRLGLSEAGLPAAVESGNSKDDLDGLPSLVWDRIVAHVHSRGGVSALEKDLAQNRTAGATIESSIAACLASLTKEEEADAEKRNEYGVEKYNVVPSSDLARPLRDEANRLTSLLAEGRSTDDVVASKLVSAKSGLDLVSKSKEELSAMLPSVTEIDDDPKVEELRLSLSLMLVDLGTSVQAIEKLQLLLVEQVEHDSFVDELAKSSDLKSLVSDSKRLEALTNSTIEARYGETIRNIDSKIESIQPAYSRILNANHEFQASRTTNEHTKKREAMLAKIDAGVEQFDQIAYHVQEGAKFYAKLTAKLVGLKDTVDDHVFVRGLERDEKAIEIRKADRAASKATAATAPIFDDGSATSPFPEAASAAVVPGVVVPGTTHEPAGGGVASMREMLGMPSSRDAELEPYLVNAGGDVNVAINHYLEKQAPTGPPPSASSTSSANGHGKRKSSMRKKASGWFKK